MQMTEKLYQCLQELCVLNDLGNTNINITLHDGSQVNLKAIIEEIADELPAVDD